MSSLPTSGNLGTMTKGGSTELTRQARTVHSSWFRGFSLIEVTIALGIVAFVAIPMMGMISFALTANRNSADRAVVSQIVDQLAREVEQSDYTRLPSEFPVAHFDEKGVRLESNDSRQVFTARARVVKGAGLPVSGGVLSSPNLAKVLIDVAANPLNRSPSDLFQEDPSGGLKNPQATRFSILVSRDD